MKALLKAAVVATWLASAMILIPASPAAASSRPVRMIVLGDSFSAGVGLGPVSSGCDRDNGNYGQRAYMEILRPRRPAGKVRIAACSGATTASMADQIASVDGSYNVAVMTVGGNDVDIFGKVKYCTRQFPLPFNCGSESYLQNLNPKPVPSWDAYVRRLADTYKKVLDRMGPDGHLYILSYPIPFAGQRPGQCAGFIRGDQIAMNAFATRLGDRTINAVDQARVEQQAVGRNAKIHYVGWRTGNVYSWVAPSGEKVRVHWDNSEGLCNSQGKTPMLNGVRLFQGGVVSNNTFHPTSTGYWYAAVQLANSINKYQP